MIQHDVKHRGIEVGDVKLNIEAMMKAKDTSVAGLTKGVEFLFKKNNVDYLKGSGAFKDEHTIAVNLNDGGETEVKGKNIIIATGSESTPFPGLTIDEAKVITSTGAISLKQVPKKMVVIGGGIIGLEMVCLSQVLRARGSLLILETGLRLVKIRHRSHSRRIPRADRWSRHGRRNCEAGTEDACQARHEVQAEYEGYGRRCI